MITSTLALWIGAAVLLFWAVGAFNRLVGLRNEIVRSFVLVDEQFRQRNALLMGLAQRLGTRDGSKAQAEALLTACAQAEAAFMHARTHPGSTGAITSLRLAEDILTGTRQRLTAPAPNDVDAQAHAAEVAASDTTFAFARRQFNERVTAYNTAVRQFPTWLVAELFRFRAAGTL
jgi:LemA protein